MRLSLLAALLICSPGFAGDEDKVPQVDTMTPRVARAGDTLVITGIALDESKVDELYLTDHKFDMRVKVLNQSATEIRMRVPPFAKPGRLQLLILTKAREAEDPKLLEQPVYVQIEEAPTEIGQIKAKGQQ